MTTFPQIQGTGLAWKAMYEADFNRRYHRAVSDKLRQLNIRLVLLAWGLALIAAVLALSTFFSPLVPAGFVIAAAAVTTLRDVLRLPDRIADARFAVRGINEEYDAMRLLWETRGKYRPVAECESFRRVSWFDDISTEKLDSDIRTASEKAAKSYHKALAAPERPAPKPTKVGDGRAGVPMERPPPDPLPGPKKE